MLGKCFGICLCGISFCSSRFALLSVVLSLLSSGPIGRPEASRDHFWTFVPELMAVLSCHVLYLPSTSAFLLPSSYFRVPTSYVLLPTSCFLVPNTYFLLPSSYFPTSYVLLPTSRCLLPTSVFLLPSCPIFQTAPQPTIPGPAECAEQLNKSVLAY